MLEKTEIQNGFRQKTTYYRWNASNQLIGITTNRGEVWYYKYDGLGRRIAKECPQRDIKIEYLWDGDQLAYTQTFKNDKLESKRHAIFNGWQLLAQQDWYSELEQHHNGNIIHQRAETSYAITQPNGKVLALFNPQGRKVWAEEPKSIWGLRLNALFSYAKPSPLNPQMLFAGQWLDEDILEKAKSGNFGISATEAKDILANMGNTRVIDVFVNNGDKGRWYVEKYLTSIW